VVGVGFSLNPFNIISHKNAARISCWVPRKKFFVLVIYHDPVFILIDQVPLVLSASKERQREAIKTGAHELIKLLLKRI